MFRLAVNEAAVAQDENRLEKAKNVFMHLTHWSLLSVVTQMALQLFSHQVVNL